MNDMRACEMRPLGPSATTCRAPRCLFRRLFGRLVSGLLGCLVSYLLSWAPSAHAQDELPNTADTGFSVERFTPPPGNTPFLAVDHADTMPHLAYSAGLSMSLMTRPIVLRDLFDQEQVTVPVATRLGFELAAAVGLGSRYQLGLVLPMVGYQSGDRLQGIGLSETALAPVQMGDIRLHARARFVGAPGRRGPAVAAGLDLGVPTGGAEHFAGERGAVIGFRVLGSWRLRWLSAALDLGARLRTTEVILLSPARPHSNELTMGVGVAANLPLPTVRYAASVIAEYAYALADTSSGSTRGPSPGEARAGIRISFCTGWSGNVGAGLGTTPTEVGSPAWRVVAGVRYERAAISDIDRDNIEDGRDLCRQQPEDYDGFEDSDGCPDKDNDKDGYEDYADDCPDEPEDFDGHRDVDGCPDEQQLIP